MSNHLKYGDYIVISSRETQCKQYLCGRSIHEESLKVLSLREEYKDFPLSFHNNANELFFKVEPQKEYGTLQEIRNTKKDDPRYSLLERRLESEQNKNKQKDQKLIGEAVKYGEIIQLYHEFTNSYVVVSKHKSPGKNKFAIRLSKTGSEQAFFKIDCPYSRQKDGLKVILEDGIILTNPSESIRLAFPIAPKYSEAYKKPNRFVDRVGSENLAFNEKNLEVYKSKKYNLNINTLPTMVNAPIAERSQFFSISDASGFSISKKFAPKVGINRFASSFNDEYSEYLSIQVAKFVPINKRKELKYGDFVRIINTKKDIGLDGIVVLDSSYKGFAPRLMLKALVGEFGNAISSVEGIFQLIPEDFSDWGEVISYSDKSYKVLCLKHYLTGGLLYLDKKNKTSSISESFDSFVTANKYKDMTKAAKDFMGKYSISCVREASSTEDETLDAENLFLIRDPNMSERAFLSFSSRTSNTKVDSRENLFVNRFFQTCAEEEELFMYYIDLQIENPTDSFYFDLVLLREIQTVTEYLIESLPLITLLQNPETNRSSIFQAGQCIGSISRLARETKESEKKKRFFSTLTQNLFKELQLFDLMIEHHFIYCLYDFASAMEQEEFELLLNLEIEFMSRCCQKNSINCYYLFQWEHLFSEILLQELQLGKRVTYCKFQIDILFENILNYTNFRHSLMRKMTSRITETFEYENFDSRSLNFLWSIFKAPEHATRDVKDVDTIMDYITNENSIQKMFRPIIEKRGVYYLKISEDKIYPLQEFGLKEARKKDFLVASIKLANELCLGYPRVFAGLYKKYIIDERIILKLIILDSLDDVLKSHLLDLFMNCYLANDCAHITPTKLSTLVKISNKSQLNEFTGESRMHLVSVTSNLLIEESTENRYILSYLKKELSIEDGEITILDYFLAYFMHPMNVINMQQTYVNSVLKLLIFMVRHGLFSSRYIKRFLYSTVNYMKNLVNKSESEGGALSRYVGGLQKGIQKLIDVGVMENKDHFLRDMIRKDEVIFEKSEPNTMGELTQLQALRKENFTSKSETIFVNMIQFWECLTDLEFERSLEKLEEDESILKCFDIKMLNELKDFDQKLIHIENMERDRAHLLTRLTEDYPTPNSHLTYILLEALQQSTELNVGKKCMDFISKLYKQRSKLVYTYHSLVFVQPDNIFNKAYMDIEKTKEELFKVKRNLGAIRDPEKETIKTKAYFTKLVTAINSILGESLTPLSEQESQRLDQQKLESVLGGQSKITRASNGWFYNVFNEYIFNLEYIDLKQKLIKESGLITMIFDFLDICNMSYLDFIQDYRITERILDPEPRESLIIGEGGPLRNEIVVKLLLILIYCTIKNPVIQKLIRKKIKKMQHSLFNLSYNKVTPGVLKYFLLLIKCTYGENLSLLIDSIERDEVLIENLSENFASIYTRNISSGLYTLMMMFSLTEFDSTVIQRNAIYMTQKIRQENYEKKDIEDSEIIYIGDFINKKLSQLIVSQKIQKLDIKEIFPDYNSSTNLKAIVIPPIVSFATHLIRLLNKNNPLRQVNANAHIHLKTFSHLLMISKEWWMLRKEIYLYLSNVYLDSDLEEQEAELINEIANITAVADIKKAVKLKQLETTENYVYIEEFVMFPNYSFSQSANVPYTGKNIYDYNQLLADFVIEGAALMIKKNVEFVAKKNTEFAQFILSGIKDSLVSQSEIKGLPAEFIKMYRQGGDNGQGLFSSIAKDKNARDEEIEHNREEMKEEIFDVLETMLDPISASNTLSIQLSQNSKTQAFQLDQILYFNHWVPDKFNPDFQGRPRFSRKNFDGNFPPLWSKRLIKSIELEEYSSLANLIFGLINLERGNKKKSKKSHSRDPFDMLRKVVGGILLVMSSTEANKFQRESAVQIISFMLKEGDSRGVNMRAIMLKQNFIKIIFESIVRFQSDEEHCIIYIDLLNEMLSDEEEGPQTQEEIFRLMRNDEENEIALALRNFLTSTFRTYSQKEIIRQNALNALKNEMKSQGTESLGDQTKPQSITLAKMRNRTLTAEDLRVENLSYVSEKEEKVFSIGTETKELMEQVCAGMEALRLMCENHFSDLQDFLRRQYDSDETFYPRTNNVNFISIISELLEEYKMIINESSIDVGVKFFELLIEMLQGPCKANQIEVCKETLLETIEDIIINLTKSKDQSISEGAVSELINSIIIFYLALLEETTEHSVISKASIHFDQDLFLDRLMRIYENFSDNINTSKFPGLGRIKKLSVFKNVMKSSSLFANNETDYTVTVDIENSPLRKEYHPIIVEGMMIIIALQTLCDLDASKNFSKSLEKTILKKIEVAQSKNLENPILGDRLHTLDKMYTTGLDTKVNERSSKKAVNYSEFYNFFKQKVSSIEIINPNKKLQKIYFPRNLVTDFLNKINMDKFMDGVSRETANDKISELQAKFIDFYEEMVHYQQLDTMELKMKLTYFGYLKSISLALVFIINFFLITFNLGPNPRFDFQSNIEYMLYMIGFIIMIIYVGIFALWLLLNAHLDVLKTVRSLEDDFIYFNKLKPGLRRSILVVKYFWDFGLTLLVDSFLLDLLLNITAAFLGLFYSKMFFSFMMLDIIGRSEMLKNVIRSVTQNLGQFMMTGLLGIIVIYVFSTITYFSSMKDTMNFMDNTDDWTFSMCSSLPHCFLTILNFGMRQGGGIGEAIAYPQFDEDLSAYMGRFSFDLVYFIFINTIYLDILFGIIIDTFDELREKRSEAGRLFVNSRKR